jgi:hypothetical protein
VDDARPGNEFDVAERRRFRTFWGPGFDWMRDHNWGGSGMIALQEMLLQTPSDRLLLLPAWPRDWNVDFKLHGPAQTVVLCHFEDGEVRATNVVHAARAYGATNLLQHTDAPETRPHLAHPAVTGRCNTLTCAWTA